ncbi:MAG: hypothetical protein ACI4UX_05140 [Clostridia bacterium]
MKKANYKYLNIKGAVLDNYQLEQYMEMIATSHDVELTSNIATYPIPRLKDNYRFIEKTYDLLNKHIKMGINLYPAGEWLLDNFYIIEETFKTVCREMTITKYKKMPGITTGMYKGFSRIYVVASEIVAYTDNKVNDEILSMAISAYQRRKNLTMEEIWNLWIFLEIAIIENIRNICEKIYSSQIQKYKVESIIERLVEKKETNTQIFKPIKDEYKENVSYKEMKYPFIEYMSYKLKSTGKKGLPYLEILEEQVNRMGMTISEVITKEHYDIAASKVSMGNSIISIKEILRVNFLDLFENINGVEEILKKDPANVYSKMDYKTKEDYRNKIKQISEKTKISEIYIANKALEMANKYQGKNIKKTHIGYYLIEDGKKELLEELEIKNVKTLSQEQKAKKYIASINIVSIILTILFMLYQSYTTKNMAVSIISGIVLYIPISQIFIQVLNYILSKRVKPNLIPKLDFSKGIPEKYSTFIVIPTIINSKEKVKDLLKKLEVYYLANKSENLYFALLGDCTSSKNEKESFDEEVIRAGIEETEKLNKKYNNLLGESNKFYFLYRNRVWNAGEKRFLGWERKRGLLCQFNDFIINGANNFRANTIEKEDASFCKKIKYVIALDSDTNLVLDSAQELIGAMAHILNKPVLAKEKNVVEQGHAIIQPRIGIDLKSSRKSLFAKIYAGLRRDRFIYKCSIRYIL